MSTCGRAVPYIEPITVFSGISMRASNATGVLCGAWPTNTVTPRLRVHSIAWRNGSPVSPIASKA